MMKTTKDHNERIAKMIFASVYPHYLNKILGLILLASLILVHIIFH
jgi:hypothetical protein